MTDIVERLLVCAKYDPDQAEAANEITCLRAEVERLTAERDRQYDQNAEQITRIAALEAENEKLRAALDKICNGPRDADLDYVDLFVEVKMEARAALEGKPNDQA